MITLDQARALDALARHGTFAKAAASLRRQHTAVLYAVRAIEAQTGFTVLDRTGYRTRFTREGEAVLAASRALLAAEDAFAARVAELRSGWEPRLGIVFDGVVPVEPVVRAVRRVTEARAPTRVAVTAAFLSGVEEAFLREHADLMISVLPPQTVTLRAVPLPPIPARLVAHKGHPLAAMRRVSADALREHVLLVVHGSDPRLQLSTAAVTVPSTVSLNDFHAKKAAIVEGLGYGWLPEAMAARELARGTLVPLRWRGARHVFRPCAYHRAERALGKAGQRVLDALTA